VTVKTTARLEGLRVLIVDDNPVNRRVVWELVKTWNMEPSSVNGGNEALTTLRQAREAGAPFDMAILDYQMPEIAGDTLGRAIKADPVLRETVLILLTSMGHRSEIPHFERIGFAGYLIKPVRPAQLLETLTTAWEAYAGRRMPERGVRPSPADKEAGSTTMYPSGAVRVLVVEDNMINQKVAVRILEKAGCRVDVAANGFERWRW